MHSPASEHPLGRVAIVGTNGKLLRCKRSKQPRNLDFFAMKAVLSNPRVVHRQDVPVHPNT